MGSILYMHILIVNSLGTQAPVASKLILDGFYMDTFINSNAHRGCVRLCRRPRLTVIFNPLN